VSIFRTSGVQSPHLWLDPNVKILAANVGLMTSVLVFWHCVVSSQCHSLFTYSVQPVLLQSPGLPARGSLQPETPCVTFAGPMWLHPKGDDEHRAVAETK
jgi:hypothetical protein